MRRLVCRVVRWVFAVAGTALVALFVLVVAVVGLFRSERGD